jgi:hypothetical protein
MQQKNVNIILFSWTVERSTILWYICEWFKIINRSDKGIDKIIFLKFRE